MSYTCYKDIYFPPHISINSMKVSIIDTLIQMSDVDNNIVNGQLNSGNVCRRGINGLTGWIVLDNWAGLYWTIGLEIFVISLNKHQLCLCIQFNSFPGSAYLTFNTAQCNSFYYHFDTKLSFISEVIPVAACIIV